MAVTFSPTNLITGASISGLSNGNLTANASQADSKFATVGKRTGKWYWEIVTGAGTSTASQVGIATIQHLQTSKIVETGYAIGWRADGAVYSSSVQRISAATMVVTPQSCTVGIAIDCDLRRIWFARDNTWVLSGDPATNTTPTVDNQWYGGLIIFPAVTSFYAMTAQFASGSLTYTPPSGFSALTDSSDFTLSTRVGDPTTWPICDVQDGGSYQITGTTTELGVAGRYRVRLVDRLNGRVIRETWSDTSGAYSFNYIAYRDKEYCVVLLDHGTSPRTAVVADFVTPVLMS